MIAGEQNFRYRPVMPHGGTGVLGIFQQSVPVGFLFKAFCVRQNTGDHAAHGIGNGHGRDFAAGEHKVSHAQLLIHALVQKSLVHALIVAAHQNQVFVPLLQFPGDLLIKGSAAGRHEDGPAGAVGFHHVGPAAVERVCLHDGAPAAAVGIIIHLHLLVGGVSPDLMGADGNVAPGLGPAQDAHIEHRIHRLGKERQNINVHHCACPPGSGPPSGWHPGPQTG